MAPLVTQTVKNLPAIQETRVQSLSWADSLEKGMATHASILTWRIPWTEEPDGLLSTGSQESDMTEQLTLPFSHLVSLDFLQISATEIFTEATQCYPSSFGKFFVVPQTGFSYIFIYLDTKPKEKNTWIQHFCFLSDTYRSWGLTSLISWLISNAYSIS